MLTYWQLHHSFIHLLIQHTFTEYQWPCAQHTNLSYLEFMLGVPWIDILSISSGNLLPNTHLHLSASKTGELEGALDDGILHATVWNLESSVYSFVQIRNLKCERGVLTQV